MISISLKGHFKDDFLSSINLLGFVSTTIMQVFLSSSKSLRGFSEATTELHNFCYKIKILLQRLRILMVAIKKQ